jgi:hypothetical protein
MGIVTFTDSVICEHLQHVRIKKGPQVIPFRIYRSIPERPKSLKDTIQRLLGKEQEKLAYELLVKLKEIDSETKKEEAIKINLI